MADNATYNYEREISSLFSGKENNSITHEKILEMIVT